MRDDPRARRFADIIGRAGGQKSAPYNRRWHLDEDQRRHHGRRTWDPIILDRLVSLAGMVDELYPPDWSGPDSVCWRGVGTSRIFLDIATDDPDHLRVLITARRAINLRPLRKLLGSALRKLRHTGKAKYQVTLSTPDEEQLQAIGQLISACLTPRPRAKRAPPVPSRRAAPRSAPRSG